MKHTIQFICVTVFVLLISTNCLSQKKNLRHNVYSEARSGFKKIFPFQLNEVELTSSWIKTREDLNMRYLHTIDPDRLLHNFRVNAGLNSTATPLEGWESPSSGLRGHFLGHYLSACAAIVSKYDDTILKHRVDYMIDQLDVCQQKLGGRYLSAFPESDFDTLEKKYGGVWAPYYTLHKIMQGLLDVYTLTGNRKAYQILLNLTDYVDMRMSRLPESEIEKILFSAEANPTNEAGGMNEVLHNLYAVSKNSKHLQLAKLFDRKWFYDPLSCKLDILSGLHSNTHIVLVNGYARRYENTGESAFKHAAVNCWDMLINTHAYVNGSSSGPRPIATTPTSRIAEHWGNPNQLSNTLSGFIAESCVTHNTQKLTANLFTWTANPEYADTYFNTFYNAVLPSQNAQDGRTVYHLPLGSPRKKEFLKENDFRCCNGSAIEAFSRLNSNIYFHDNNNLWVNLYIPSKVYWKEKKLVVEQMNAFPDEAQTRFRITTEHPVSFALQIFIPSWAGTQSKVYLNGRLLDVKATSNSFVKLDRQWKSGDVVRVEFKYHFFSKSMPDNKKVLAFFYGPTLLAFETNKELILKGTRSELVKHLTKKQSDISFTLKNNDSVFNLMPFYKIAIQSYGVYATIRNEF